MSPTTRLHPRAPLTPRRADAPGHGRSTRLLWALSAFVVVQLALLVVTLVNPGRFLTGAMPHEPGDAGLWIALALQGLGLALTLVTLWRVWLVARYRPSPDVGDARLPPLTVLVPAYNEGRQVLSTLRSLGASRYPASRLQIIVIDDGSQDDTWLWIRRGVAELGERVTAVRSARNQGKKHALAQGVRRASGEVIVTVDSDSEVLPDTLRLLVAPLVLEPGCGAVAGSVRVLNRHAGALPRMLDACFTASFDFGRAGESEVGGVMCCPGALSAWRAGLFRDVLEEWLGQTFFGRPASIGEDRALTNLVLRSGATVRYQSTSIVLTQVPSSARVLCRMFLRWGRSNVRESLVLGRFVFGARLADGGSRRGLQLLFVSSVVGMLLSSLLFVPMLVVLALHPSLLPLFLGLTLVSAVPTAAVTLAARDRRTAMWAIPWGLYSTLVTAWIPLWSLLTLHRGGWLTRGTPQPVPVAPLPVPEREARAA